MKRFKSRTAVITGAAGGIGRATALALADKGCQVALADIDEQGLGETARMVGERGQKASVHRVDVANRARMQSFADEVIAEHGGVHILINNAGVSAVARFVEHSLEDFEWVIGINFWGVVYGCKMFLPHLLKADEAHIVNISSVFGLIGVPMQSSYCASKFAVRGFSESLRAELAGSHVGVTSVHPGGVATRIAERSRVSGGEDAQRMHDKSVARFRSFLPPEKAAQNIVRGIEKNRPRVLFTPETHVADWIERLFPARTSELVGFAYERLLS